MDFWHQFTGYKSAFTPKSLKPAEPFRLITTAGRATANLSLYIENAILPHMPLGPAAPQMPPDGHKSHLNILAVRPENWRSLESIQSIEADDFLVKARFFTTNIHYGPLYGIEDMDEITGEQITIPAKRYFEIPPRIIGHPSNIEKVCRWVIEYPMETLQRVMHITFPDTAPWTFDSYSEKDVDSKVLRHITWGRDRVDGTRDAKVVVLIQSPWILSPRDLSAFTECKGIPKPSDFKQRGANPEHYESHERMWGKVWDLCYRQKCRWFVVTSYWGWVFGTFSDGWTRAYVSPVVSSDNYRPTVLECLVFWFASAFRMDGGFSIPEVPEPVENPAAERDCSTPTLRNVRFSPPPPSESDWDASSSHDDHLSSAGTEEAIDIRISINGVMAPTMIPVASSRRAHSRPAAIERVQSWQRQERQSELTLPRPGNMRIRQGSPAPSEGTESTYSSSASTVRDYSGTKDTRGTWLSTNSTEAPSEFI
ncbi:hypothetical protein C8Q75DRAFT_740501 [Abortiporus biennis]|nr:hypothetical protein C8Q75DRAFT_740501 [Abortiporus biennis]